MSAQPNLLFVITDHHAWYQHSQPDDFHLELPVWERFCAEGVRFERAYSVCPLCSPARASMMTGLYPSAHGMTRNTEVGPAREFRPQQLLYSHHLSRAGYRNAYVGKWHCGHERLPVDYGIEGWSLPDYGKVYMSDAYRRYADERGFGDARARIEHNLNHPEWSGQTLTLHHESPWRFMNGSGVLEGPPEAHEEQFVAHLACEKLRELAADDQPFSLVVSFWGPHQPYYPTEPYASMVEAETIPEYPSFNDDLAGRPLRHFIHRECHHTGAKDWRDWAVWREVMVRAYGQQLQLDAAVGQVLDTLSGLGLAEDTLVIWCADHGDALASHGGLWDKAATMTEEVMKVPLALRWPAGTEGGVSRQELVSNLDVTATMLDAAGADIPESMQSRSLLPLSRGETDDRADEVILEHNGKGPTNVIQRMLVRGRYKYVAALYDGDELYDLGSDPFEMHNLVAESGYADIGREMRGRLLRHIEETGDPIAGDHFGVALRHSNDRL